MTRIAGPRLPIVVTEMAYSRAAVAADMVGMSLREYAEEALEVANVKAFEQHQTRLYEQVCKDAIARNQIMPTRHEWDREQKKSFVRRPTGESMKQAGRPSSRQHQNGTEHRPGQKREAGPERSGATRSKASMARTREDPPFDQGEHRGTASMEPPGEERWGPTPGEIVPPVRKHKPGP